MTPLAGIFPTVLTPLTEAEDLDVPALEAQLAWLLSAGVHGLMLLGSIGESPFLGDGVRAELIRRTVAAAGDVPLLAGITCFGTRAALGQLEEAPRLGATAAVVALPSYFELSFADVHRHFAALGAAGLLPVLYYHYVPATRLALRPEEVAELLHLPGIAGAKESTFDVAEVEAHVALTRGASPSLLAGSELGYPALASAGVSGAISAGAVLMPKVAVALHEAVTSGDREQVRALEGALFETLAVVRAMSGSVRAARLGLERAMEKRLPVPQKVDTTLARMKAALAARGVPIAPTVARPLPPLDAAGEALARAAAEKMAAAEAAVTP